MNVRSRTHQTFLGVLLAMLTVGAEPAHAQWAVYDAANHATNIEHKIQDTLHWIQQLNDNIQHYEMLIKQWTTAKDILTNAEKLVDHNVRWASTMASIGASVRGVFQIKEQIQSLVRLRIVALKSISGRLKRGIFDPSADLRDLEEYLTFGLGRASYARIATLQRLADFDNTLQTLYERWQTACAKKAGLEKELENLKRRHDEAVARGDAPDAIASVELQIKQVEQQIADIDKVIDDLWTKLVERARLYHARIVDREDAAAQILVTEAAWNEVLPLKDDALDELERYDGSQRDSRPRWVDPPADPGPVFGGQQ